MSSPGVPRWNDLGHATFGPTMHSLFFRECRWNGETDSDGNGVLSLDVTCDTFYARKINSDVITLGDSLLQCVSLHHNVAADNLVPVIAPNICSGSETELLTVTFSNNYWTTAPSVRLAGGAAPFEGRVEAFVGGRWGSVCDDAFSNSNAQVGGPSAGIEGRK